MASKTSKAVTMHRAGSKRAKAHAIILKAGGKNADPEKTILAIKKLKVKPATATSWFYDMRRTKSKEHRAE
jgi:hypothetical protein